MANVFSNLLPTAVDAFYGTIASKSQDYKAIARERTDAVAQMKIAELRTGGSAAFTAGWDGSVPTPTDFDSAASSTYSPVAYLKQHRITKFQAEDNPLVVMEVAQALADDATRRIRNLVWTTFGGLTSLAHPTIGGKFCVDSFSSPVSQTNKGTSALSLSALDAMRIQARRYKDHNGDLVDFEGFSLIVPPGLETIAKQLVIGDNYPNAATNGGESDLYNTFKAGGDSGLTGVLVAPALSDANDWALVHTASDMRKPMDLWMRSPIQIIPSLESGSNSLLFTVTFRAACLPRAHVDSCVFYNAVV